MQIREEYREMFSEVQGNILKVFGKPENRFIFFEVLNQKSARDWFASFSEDIPNTLKLVELNELRKQNLLKNTNTDNYNFDTSSSGTSNFDPDYPYTHISFTSKFLKKIGKKLPPSHGLYTYQKLSDPVDSHDIITTQIQNRSPNEDEDPFNLGMLNRLTVLGDKGDNSWENWEDTFKSIGRTQNDLLTNSLDGVIIVAHDCAPEADSFTNKIVAEMKRNGIKCVGMESGSVIPNEQNMPAEHFGFRDGLSQPLINGLDDEKIDKRKINKDSFEPHYFVTHSLKNELKWANNGSFLVFRKLEQDVNGFRDFLKVKSLEYRINPELLAAKIMGRWKSGAPLALYPNNDPGLLDESKYNDFVYRAKETDNHESNIVTNSEHNSGLVYNEKPIDNIKANNSIIDDSYGLRTPRFAHIRKSNPRNDGSFLDEVMDNSLSNEHRILRRGITYGPRVDGNGDLRRGLLFVCFQIDLSHHFEFIQRNYANNPLFPSKDVRFNDNQEMEEGHGRDMIAGQNDGSNVANLLEDKGQLSIALKGCTDPISGYGSDRPSVLEKDTNIGARVRLEGFMTFVHNKGGEYFFSPSISALKRDLWI